MTAAAAAPPPAGRAPGRTHPERVSTPVTRLLSRLWADDCGVVTLEYLTLASIVGLGGAAGLTSMQDSMNEEYRACGRGVHAVAGAHRAPAYDHRPVRQAPELTYGGRPTTDMTP